MTYRFAVLKPFRAPKASEYNARILSQKCLGIEVTEPELARLCSLGNLDPQHSDGRTDVSAIAEALTFQLPPDGSSLVTIREDMDALGAMAVLSMRSAGFRISIKALNRIGIVDQADRFANGPWPGVRRMPRTAAEIDEVGYEPNGYGAIALIARNSNTALEERIELISRWITHGDVPVDASDDARRSVVELFEAIEAGDVSITDIEPARLAYVRGFAPGVLRLAYRKAPVVIAETFGAIGIGQLAYRKLTIGQYAEGYVPLKRIQETLNVTEPGWGGTPTIIGSPQGVGSKTPLPQVIKILLDSLKIRGVNHLDGIRVGLL